MLGRCDGRSRAVKFSERTPCVGDRSTLEEGPVLSKILTDAVERLRGAGVDFGDVRQVERSTERITAKGERIDTHSVSDERRVCVRAAVDGRWGCAAGVVTDAGSAVRLAEQAVVQAKRRAAVEGVVPRWWIEEPSRDAGRAPWWRTRRASATPRSTTSCWRRPPR